MGLFSDKLETYLNKAGQWVESVTGNVINAVKKEYAEGAAQPSDESKAKFQAGLSLTMKTSMAQEDQQRADMAKTGQAISKAGSFVKSVAQSVPRAITSVALEPTAGIMSLAQGKTVEPVYTPKTKTEKFLMGEEPVKGIFLRQKEAQEKVEGFGVNKGSSMALGVLGVAGITAMDLTPIGGKKETAELIARSKGVSEIVELLRPMFKTKTADELKYLAETLVPVTSKSNVTDILLKEASLAKELPLQKASNINSGPTTRERGFVTSVKEVYPEATKVAGQYIPRSTDELAIKAKNLIKDDIVTAEKIAETGTDDNAVAIASELIKHYGDQATQATDITIKNALYDKAAEIANSTAQKLTELGRSVQAASILGRLTPEGQVKFAAMEIQKYNAAIEKSYLGSNGLRKKIPELTGEQASKIVEEMKAIEAMPEGTEKAMRFKELQNSIVDLIPSTIMAKAISIWKAGLLTGLKTSGLNIFSNLTHVGMEKIKDIPAVAIDKVTALFTKKRTTTLTIKGYTKGIREGFEKGWTYFKTGYSDRDLGIKLDYKRVNFGKSKVAKAMQTYEETIFRIIGAEDQPFFYGTKANSIYKQAIAKAKTLNLHGSAYIDKIEELVENPTDEMLRYALLDAETAVFQNKTSLGDAASSIQKIGEKELGPDIKIGEIIVPFGRTPSAVAMQVINYSPIGVVKTIIENVGKGRFDQKLFSEGIGRGITGSGIMAIGSSLMAAGLISLSYPKTEKEQKLWEIEGRKANSIKIGDKWRSVQVLGPAGNLLLVGGAFEKNLKDEGSVTKAMATALATGGKSFLESTFLSGLNQSINALNDPKRYAEGYLGSLVSSSIPTIVSDISRAIDPMERRAVSVDEKVKARIPGVRQTLEPQVTVFGKEKERVGNFLEVLADPTRPYRETITSVTSELRRMWDAGYEVSPTLLGDKQGYSGLTPEQNTELWKRAGEITEDKLTSLFSKEEYKKMPDENKAKIIDDVVDKSKTMARVEQALFVTEGLQGEELLTKLKELKAGGLMTATIFKEYQRLR